MGKDFFFQQGLTFVIVQQKVAAFLKIHPVVLV